MSIGIYKITNLINGKSYIGKSIDIHRRWRSHRSYPDENKDYPLYRAFRKYGIENFSFDILEECPQELLDTREKFYIQKYNTHNSNYGYNQTTGGDGSSNCVIRLTDNEIKEIYELLIEDKISQNEIARKFSVGADTISEINNGKTRVRDGYAFPLRNNRAETKVKMTREEQSIIRRTVDRPSREELKFLIRNKSFLEIGRLYHVSDNAVKKWCKFENLPYRKKDIKLINENDWNNL